MITSPPAPRAPLVVGPVVGAAPPGGALVGPRGVDGGAGGGRPPDRPLLARPARRLVAPASRHHLIKVTRRLAHLSFVLKAYNADQAVKEFNKHAE